MPSTTIRISESTRRMLGELARQDGKSLQSVIDRAIETYRRQRFLEGLHNDFAALRNDPDAWQARHPGVRLVPVLSEPDPAWRGRSGFVHEVVLADHPDLSGHEVYACGNPLMVEAARASFTGAAQLPATRFHADAFIARH